MEEYLLIFGALCAIGLLLYIILRNPFRYPYKIITLDISGRRNVKSEDEIDKYLCDCRIRPFIAHYGYVQDWKDHCERQIDDSILKSLRQSQYYKVLDDEHMFIFSFVREQTRYRQVNYVRSAYKVSTQVNQCAYTLNDIKHRYTLLEQIGFQCTISEYHSKNQRKLMTKQLREQIQRRDSFTCQICGKYMPDGVGLHIDHIIPVAKGGKSIPSNLQVLCSKCNGHKSSNI